MEKINKYLEQVDMIELYITKNIIKLIKNPKELKFIKSNIFLLGFNNKNYKNSLKVLLENNEFEFVSKLIKEYPQILNFKNTNKINLFQMIIPINYFYDLIIELIENLDRSYLIELITNQDKNLNNSIDLLLSIININTNIIVTNLDNEIYEKIKLILKLIYELDAEENTLLINKICMGIKSEKILLDIIKYINPKNLDIYPDSNTLTCIDYLLANQNVFVLNYLIPKINYIYFTNTDNNFLFDFVKKIKEISVQTNYPINSLIKLIFDILSKSNVKTIKNYKNENIFIMLNELVKSESNDSFMKKFIKKNKSIDLSDIIDIHDQSIDGITLEDDKVKQFYKININYSKLLTSTDIGIFNSDMIHNMLYTTIMLKKYKDIIIPYYIQDSKYNQKQIELINLSNNNKYIGSFFKNYFKHFNAFVPYIIIWKNSCNYYFDQNLIRFIIDNSKDYLKSAKSKKSNRFMLIRLSINLLDTPTTEGLRHANIILIDNHNKIVERFEPYGEINYKNSRDINSMIEKKICNPLAFEFKFVQSYPGFQARSDEFNKYNKVYGDPFGYCLAWCLIYLETKLLLVDEKKTNPIDYINWYIINQFSKDFPEIKSDLQYNKYMTFIRYYSKNLDERKNDLLKKLDIDPKILYHTEIDESNFKNIVKKINNELFELIDQNN